MVTPLSSGDLDFLHFLVEDYQKDIMMVNYQYYQLIKFSIKKVEVRKTLSLITSIDMKSLQIKANKVKRRL